MTEVTLLTSWMRTGSGEGWAPAGRTQAALRERTQGWEAHPPTALPFTAQEGNGLSVTQTDSHEWPVKLNS